MQLREKQNETISFGPFELNVRSGEIRRGGTTLKLAPQPFTVLLLLVENAGRLVTRAELKERIWGADTFVDFDKGLNLCIAQIREALGDDAKSPRYIETLPRRGYRLNANVEKGALAAEPPSIEVQETACGDTPQLSPGPEQNASRKANGSPLRISRAATLILPVITMCLIALGAAFYFRSHQTAPKAPTPTSKSMLLVLPFENLTSDPSQDYFSEGLTEEMITRLGSLQPQRLGVIARTTTLTYKHSSKSIRQIGSELGVGYVLEGSARRAAGRLRITAQLIQVADQTQLWAETYDCQEADALEIQREVATRVAASLSLELFRTSAANVASKSAQPEAYDAYLKGRYLKGKDLKRSLSYFDEAIKKDPNFAPAYVAQVEAIIDHAALIDNNNAERLTKAKTAALKAVELNPAYAEAHAALGSVNFWWEWNWRAAEMNFKRAIELNPNNPHTRLQYGDYLLARGRKEAAVSEVNEAVKLDPVSPSTVLTAAYFQLRAGRYDEAIALSHKMLELEPKSALAHECMFRAHARKGQHREAINVLRERLALSGASRDELDKLYKQSPTDVIAARFRQELDQRREDARKGEKVLYMRLAYLCTWLGDHDQAFEWLEKAASKRAPSLAFLGVDPIWEPLRSDHRFARLVRMPS